MGCPAPTILAYRYATRSGKSLLIRVIYLLEDTVANRSLIHNYLDVFEYPDGRIEIRADGVALPCRPYDRLSEIDQGAVVNHKRLGHVLQVAQLIQADLDNRRASGSPSRTNQGSRARFDLLIDGRPAENYAVPGTRSQRRFACLLPAQISLS